MSYGAKTKSRPAMMNDEDNAIFALFFSHRTVTHRKVYVSVDMVVGGIGLPQKRWVTLLTDCVQLDRW